MRIRYIIIKYGPPFMKKIILVCLSILTAILASNALFAASEIVLTPAEGFYKFPFFDTKTPVWQYNDQIPGPIIRGKVSSILNIRLENKLAEPTTIHWHGLRIENAMDGVPGITQDAVNPGESFVYRLRLEEAGTYWYHPHFNNSEQIERGLKGVLIVEEKEELPWSRDTIWLLDDWRLQKDGTIYPKFNTPHDLMHDGRWGNVSTINGEYQPNFKVKPGERIRLRLINGANARVFSPHFKDLSAKVIAVDGRPVSQIFALNNFRLSPGNRLDLDIVIPKNSGGKTFQIMDNFPRKNYPLAVITVRDEPAIATPNFEPVISQDFITAEIFDDVPISKTWDLSAFRGGKLGIGWGMNNQLWPEADTADFQTGVPRKIAFNNSSSRLHPMHIHGVFFRVLERNGDPTVEPFTRDTVLIGPKENVVIGLIPEHEGIWATHCHILEHAEAGMMTTVNVGSSSDSDSP
jgi:FtsP/CotA-like multicopper oxidase with cupredoxin domain